MPYSINSVVISYLHDIFFCEVKQIITFCDLHHELERQAEVFQVQFLEVRLNSTTTYGTLGITPPLWTCVVSALKLRELSRKL